MADQEPDDRSVVLPLSGDEVYLREVLNEDPEQGLVCAVGGTRVTPGRLFGQRWASHVYGVRPTPEPVSVWVCRSSRWRFSRRWHEAEVVYGPEGVWAAEILGRWDVVEVSHEGQTHRTGISPGRLWEFAFPRAKQRDGDDGVIFGPGEGPET